MLLHKIKKYNIIPLITDSLLYWIPLFFRINTKLTACSTENLLNLKLVLLSIKFPLPPNFILIGVKLVNTFRTYLFFDPSAFFHVHKRALVLSKTRPRKVYVAAWTKTVASNTNVTQNNKSGPGIIRFSAMQLYIPIIAKERTDIMRTGRTPVMSLL